MSKSKGIITRKDVIEEEAINWGPEYAKQTQIAIDKNKEFVQGILQIATIQKAIKDASTNSAYINAKQQEVLATQKAILAIKEQEAAEISANKVKISAIALEEKQAKAKQSTVKLSIEERTQNEINNRLLKQEVLAKLNLTEAYSKLNKQRTEAKNRLRELIITEGESSKATKQAAKEFQNLDEKVKKADHAVGDFSKNVGNYKTAFKGLGDIFSAFGLLGGITGAVALGKEIFNTTKEIQSLDLALKSVTGSQENFTEQQSFLSTIANKYGLEIKNLTKQYTAFYVAAKDKLAANEIQNLFENISKSGAALGLSNETLERSFQAVNQMLSKGTVASEELRGQLAESMPGAVQAMTKAVQILHPEIKNLTEKGLFEMIKAGKILASEVLPETARQLVILTGADKAEGVETITKSVNKLSNSWTKMIVSINESDTSGFSKFVKEIIGGLTNIMDFTGLLFKDENQLQDYFKDLGKSQGLEEFKAVMKNISTVSKEQQDATKKALLERERENIRVNNAIVQAEKKKRESIMGGDRALFHLQTKQEEDALVQIGKSAAIIKKLKEGAGTKVQNKTGTATETNPVIAQPRKTKLDDSAYQLEKQRLELAISTNDQIAKNEEKTDSERLHAVEERSNKELALIDLNKDKEFSKNKETYNNAVSYAQAKMQADLSASKLTEEGKAKIKNEFKNEVSDAFDELLNANEKTRINEKYAYDKLQIQKKTSEEIDKINQFDEKQYTDDLLTKTTQNEIASDKAIAKENENYKAILENKLLSAKEIEDAAQKHEENLFNIKLESAKKLAKILIANTETELEAYKAQSDGSAESNAFILALEKKLYDAKAKFTELDLERFKKGENEKVMTAKEKAVTTLEIAMEVTGELSNLSNAFSDAKIQKIDQEIEKNNEYYDKRIELAGNDERQKDLLQNERDKKNEELEKKKRAAQHKQAVFDKALNATQVAMATALAVIKAWTEGDPYTKVARSIMAGVVGAIQLATVLSTPIPKYKYGRKGGKKEIAMINDGVSNGQYVQEVIERKSGSLEVPTGKNKIVQLYEGDTVHKSVADYNKLQRAAMIASLNMEGRNMSNFQATQHFESNNKELVEEMRLTRKAIEKNKTNVTINVPKVDIPHEIWKSKNTNWGK